MIRNRVVIGLAFGLALMVGGPGFALAADGPADELANEASADAGEDGDAGRAADPVNMDPLDPLEWQTDLAIWTGVVFLTVMTILWKFAWGPIAQGLELREQGIAGQIADADKANQDAKDLLKQYKTKLSNSKDEVRAILDKAKQDAEKAGRSLIEKARSDAEAEQRRSMRQIDAATSAALKELADRGATLAVSLAGKIVGAELKASDHAKLIEKSVSGLARQTPSNN